LNPPVRFHRAPCGEWDRVFDERRRFRLRSCLFPDFVMGCCELTLSTLVALRHSHRTVSMNIIIFLVVSFWCFPETASYADVPENVFTVFTYADSVFSTESYPMAKPLKGGPLRILLFGNHGSAGRMSIEITARLDCRLSAVFTRDRKTLYSSASGEGKGVEPEDSLIARRLGELLAERWDVFWLDFDVESLPAVLRDKLMGAVERGAGLVFVGDRKDIRSYVTKRRIDGRALEVVSYGETRAETAGRRKRGIVVCMPPPPGEGHIHEMYDYFSCAVNAILFASPGPKETAVVKVHAPKKIEYESMHFVNLRLDLYHAGEGRPMDVCCRYRDAAGRIVHESVERFNIRKGRSFINLDYPVLPVGRYSLDVSISDEGGVTVLAGTSFVVAAAQSIEDVKLWSPVSMEGGVIAGTVRLSEKFREGMRLRAELLDSRGRLYDSSELEVIPGRYTSQFSFLARETCDRVMTVAIHFIKGGEPVQTVARHVYLRKPYDSHVFSLMVGGAGSRRFGGAGCFGSLRDAGVAAFVLDLPVVEEGGGVFERVLEASVHGSEVIPVFRCADVEGYGVRAAVDTLRRLGLPGYIVRLEGCGRPRESFGEYLGKKYGTVESLNEAWGTRFTSFEQVSSASSKEPGPGESCLQRLDSVLYEEHTALGLRRGIREYIVRSDSTARVGVIGTPPVPAAEAIMRVDMPEPVMTGFGAGLNPRLENVVLLRGNDDEGAMVIRRLEGGMLNRLEKPFLRTVPWRSLFTGMNGIWWDVESGWMDSPLTPAGSPSPAFSTLAGEVNEITKGIDRLLSGCTGRPGRIGILYSPLSILAAETANARRGADGGSFNPAVESLRAFYLLCRDTGYTPVFVTEEQVSAGLPEGDYTALVLPFVQPLSDELSGGLEAFVTNGGRLIADVGTGVMDENLAARKRGALDDVFGIVQSAGGVLRRGRGVLEPLDAGEVRMTGVSPIPDSFFDGNLELREGGRAFRAASIDGVPAMVVNGYGEGRTVFYNLAMWTYSRFRDGEPGDDLRNLFLSSMRLLYGAEETGPYAVLRDGGKNVRDAVLYVFRDGDAAYIGVLPDPSMKTDGGGGTATLEISGSGGRKAVYDVRNGVFLGMIERIPVSLKPGEARLFALLPYRVRELKVTVDKPVVKTGDKLGYGVAVVPHESGVEPGRHVFRVSVVGPDGKERPCFTGSFDGHRGAFRGSLRIALNDTPGRWTLRVADTATGKRAERAFMVMARDGTTRFPR